MAKLNDIKCLLLSLLSGALQQDQRSVENPGWDRYRFQTGAVRELTPETRKAEKATFAAREERRYRCEPLEGRSAGRSLVGRSALVFFGEATAEEPPQGLVVSKQ
ncbi:hypothetical protein AV530_003936 [Patagioenas fasciata monilis]|uniref:Uncharacterized protein n=1 Tax=Patagioenas fasciata monilis TaxID=372326 RepID=A0A1V4KZ33_PATFA|nr:hypothetical protein AV530_003936 [Patagioenas fasciata monilis]